MRRKVRLCEAESRSESELLFFSSCTDSRRGVDLTGAAWKTWIFEPAPIKKKKKKMFKILHIRIKMQRAKSSSNPTPFFALSTIFLELVELFAMKLCAYRDAEGQALAHGRRKDTITMTRERDRGRDRRRMRGREREDGHRDISLEPRGSSTGLFWLSTVGRQMISGLTCDMLSWKTSHTHISGFLPCI